MKPQKTVIKYRMTVPYAALQASFWMDLCIALSFASVYLKGIGYSNTGLGWIIAAGSLAGASFGPLISSLIDRYEKITASGLMLPVIFARAVMILSLIINADPGILTTISFALFTGFSMCVNSLILKMYVDAGKNGAEIDFGIARGCGSFAYVVISFILGAVVNATTVRAVVWAAAVICVLQLASYMIFTAKLNVAGIRSDRRDEHEAAIRNEERGSGLIQFAADNRKFCLLLLGTLLIFFSHNTLCNFLINVTENAGGDAGDMGLLNGFMAAVEIPVMFLFSRVFGKKNIASVLRFAFIFFTFKAAAVAAASSLTLLGAAMLLQAPSFALYTPAIVPYTEKTVRHEDSAKAQSLAFSMTTLGSVLAGTISGTLLDHTSVTVTLWIAAAVCLAGTVTAIMGLEK